MHRAVYNDASPGGGVRLGRTAAAGRHHQERFLADRLAQNRREFHVRRSFLFALFVVVWLLPETPDALAEGVDKPNFIVIFTDDHGYADLSCQDIVQDVKTPHIDALAGGGVRMTSGYVTAPQCVPSRAGLMSGRYQNRFGVESNGEALEGFNAQQTIAERLKQAGYATGMTGKWHLGPAAQIVDHGFDDVFYRGGTWTNYNLQGADVAPGTRFDELYHLDANAAAAQAFIKRHHDEPFFFYLAFRAPHVPLDATEKYLRRFPGEMPERRRKALAMISAIDDGVGAVMQTLREYGLEEKTLVFLIGDNGAPLKIHKEDAPGIGPGWDGSLNDPLNGEKGMLTEGGMRVPFVMSWKGRLPAGRVYDEPVISLDVAATVATLAGLPDDPQLDGVNLMPYLTGKNETPPHEALFWRWIAQSAVREGNWKYLRGGARDYLFDLANDAEEKHDVLAEHPEVARRLRTRLEAWSKQLHPPGLATRPMATTWEQYFDFYLDGKPAPPRNTAGGKIDGWVVRNGTAKLADDALRVRPKGGKGRKRALFIAAARLNLPAASTAVIRLRTSRSGGAGIAWREAGQNDFPAGQVVKFRCEASDEWQQHAVRLPADGKVIHVRLLLPEGGADVESIAFRDTRENVLQSWRFDKQTPEARRRGR